MSDTAASVNCLPAYWQHSLIPVQDSDPFALGYWAHALILALLDLRTNRPRVAELELLTADALLEFAAPLLPRFSLRHQHLTSKIKHWSLYLLLPLSLDISLFIFLFFLHDYMRCQSLFSFHFFHCVLELGPASSDIQFLIGYNHGSSIVGNHCVRRSLSNFFHPFLFFLEPRAGMMDETWVGHLS